MLQTALWTLRQPRYRALALLMSAVALICVSAGTWQVVRFQQSVHDNRSLTANAHAATVPLRTSLVPLVGQGAAPGRLAIRYRTVAVSGSYLPDAPQFLRNQTQDGVDGYYVLNPLRTADGTLLVVRGFVAADPTGAPPKTIAAPPTGPVQITGRLQTASNSADKAASLGGHQLESINPTEQAARLGTPVYQAYLTLNAGQPGTAGVSALPEPDLSNPAGGAFEWQHFAYVIQWYVFALLALAAPFAIARHEVRETRRRFLGVDEGDVELGLEPDQLPDTAPGAIALRDRGALARRELAQQYRRAARLADRYGRSLGVGGPPAGAAYSASSAPVDVSRSGDAYHAAYNDQLWLLAMGDGEAQPSPPRPDDRELVILDGAPVDDEQSSEGSADQ